MKTIAGILIMALIMAFAPGNISTNGQTNSTAVFNEVSPNAISNCSTIIMQGNTESASDCLAFENALKATGNGYNSFTRKGWYIDSDGDAEEYYDRVTSSEFSTCTLHHVAYYSGHGGRAWYGVSKPILNAPADTVYGSSSHIDVASVFGVLGSDWQTACTIPAFSNLELLAFASCWQLDSTIVHYYARVLKASNIRTIVGYHDLAPTLGDDLIATSFVQNADSGYNVLAAWMYANSGQNWAVLLQTDDLNNDNQVAYMPGFPGRTYEEPSSSANVYRYANFLATPRLETTEVQVNLAPAVQNLPLTLTLSPRSDNEIAAVAFQPYSRDYAWSTVSVADDDQSIADLISTSLGENVHNMLSAQYYVAKDEVDENTGIDPNSQVVVERTYNYYDTYLGVKLVDSRIRATIDGEGIRNVIVDRYIASPATNAAGHTASDIISVQNALKHVYEDHSCIGDSELYAVSLAYVPNGSGNHVLCYEFMFSHGFCYVDVVTGEILSY